VDRAWVLDARVAGAPRGLGIIPLAGAAGNWDVVAGGVDGPLAVAAATPEMFSAAAGGRGESLCDGCGNWSIFACCKANRLWALGVTIGILSPDGTFAWNRALADRGALAPPWTKGES
jgi:hypothetical protein